MNEAPGTGAGNTRTASAAEANRSWLSRWALVGTRPEVGSLAALLAVYILFAFATRGTDFIGVPGTVGWLNQAAELGIIAIPVGLLMIAGEFDLSVGSIVAAAGMFVAIGTNIFGIPIWITILMAVAFGTAVGFLNGVMVVRTGLPSFIVTLASNFSVAGATIGISRYLANTSIISIPPSDSARLVFATKFGDANISVLWWLLVAALGTWVLLKTVFGNWILATGGNKDVARAAGVPTSMVKTVLFVVCGAAASLVGVMSSIGFNSGNAAVGQNFVFEAPVAAVIGGIALHGGYGSTIGIVFGTAIYGVISVGIFYTGWSTEWIGFFLGILLFLAVLTNNYFRKLALRAA